jgi:hypothetical protein
MAYGYLRFPLEVTACTAKGLSGLHIWMALLRLIIILNQMYTGETAREATLILKAAVITHAEDVWAKSRCDLLDKP